jgi:outer membrane protein TolC
MVMPAHAGGDDEIAAQTEVEDVGLRALDAELETVAQTVRLREESVAVNQRRFDLGDIGEFDLTRAKTELSATRAEAIGLQRQRTNAEHALAVLRKARAKAVAT